MPRLLIEQYLPKHVECHALMGPLQVPVWVQTFENKANSLALVFLERANE